MTSPLRAQLAAILIAAAFLFGLTAGAFATCSAPGHTVGTYGAAGAAGWTTFCASDGTGTSGMTTQRIYVSSSTGNDSWDGLAPAFTSGTNGPKASLSVAIALITKGTPAWLLLKKGDTWTGDVASGGLFGDNGNNVGRYISGPNSNELAVIGTYDPAFPGSAPYYEGLINPISSSLARPFLSATNSDNGGPEYIISGVNTLTIDNVAIVGLDTYSPAADPASGSYVPTLMSSVTASLTTGPPLLHVTAVSAGQITAGQHLATSTGNGLQSTFTGTVSNGSGGAGNILSVSGLSAGTVLGVGTVIDCTAVCSSPMTEATITSLGTGTGTNGTYNLSGPAQLVASEAMNTNTDFIVGTQVSGTTGGVGVYNINVGQTTNSGQIIATWPGNQVGFFQMYNTAHTILLEDDKVRFSALKVQGGGSGSSFIMRRSSLTENYDIGIFASDYATVLLEDVLLDHNGWQPNGWRNTFYHNIYGSQGGGLADQQWTFRGVISTRGSDVCLRSRHGGDMIDNYLAQCGWAFDYGGVSSVTSNSIVNNVVQQGVSINADIVTGGLFTPVGINSGTDSSGYNRPTTVTGNIVVHSFDATAYGAGPYGINLGGGSQLNTVSTSIVGDWGNNSSDLITDFTGNNTLVAGGGTKTTSIDLVAYALANSLTWSDPNRTALTYDLSLGGPGTFDSFIAQVKLQSKTNWRTAYTAPVLNTYIRAGFLPAAGGSTIGLIKYGR